MKHLFYFPALLLIVALGPQCSSVLSQDTDAGQPVQIELRDVAAVQRPLIQVQDVARVWGGSPQLAANIRRLDLHELRRGERAYFEASHVKIRLLLAGFSRDEFQIVGSGPVLVEWQERTSSPGTVSASPRPANAGKGESASDATPLTELTSALSQAIRGKVSESFSLLPEAVLVQLDDRASESVLRQIAGSANATPQFELLDSGRQALGTRRLRLAVMDDDVRKQIVTVLADTSIVVQTPVAKAAIVAGDMFSSENVLFQTSEIKNPFVELVTEATLFGKYANRRIALGAEIPFAAVQNQTAAGVNDGQQVIKSQDLVSVLARVGGVSVRLSNATALQAGKLGDVIRVRNEDSQKTLTCRVISPNEVEAIIR